MDTGKTPTPNDTVVNMMDLNLAEDLYDTLADLFEVRNGSIVRYFPLSEYSNGLSPEQKAEFNRILQEQAGVVFPEPASEEDSQRFYGVLLEFSW